MKTAVMTDGRKSYFDDRYDDNKIHAISINQGMTVEIIYNSTPQEMEELAKMLSVQENSNKKKYI